MLPRRRIIGSATTGDEAEGYAAEPRAFNDDNVVNWPGGIAEERKPVRLGYRELYRRALAALRRITLFLHFAAIARAVNEARVPIITFALVAPTMLVFAAIVGHSPMVAGQVLPPGLHIRPELNAFEGLFLGPWQHWDGLWYLQIAAQGYDAHSFTLAFFPLYPILIKGVSYLLFNLNYTSAGVLISIVSFLISLICFYKLASQEIGESAARRGLIYLAIFPTAYYFLAVYTEALFLALSLAAFLYARKGRWTIAGVLGLLASLSRSTGLLLALPLLIEYLQQRRFNPRAVRADVLNLSLVPLGTALFAAYNQLAFGNVLLFITVQSHWERVFKMPWDTLTMAWQATALPNVALVTPPDGSILYEALRLSNLPSVNVYSLAFFILGATLTLIAFVKLRPAYGVYAFLALAIPLFSPKPTEPLLSMARFVLILFPLFFALGMLGKNRLLHWAIIGIFATGLFFFLIRFAAWYWLA